jgi:hypothetical protein
LTIDLNLNHKALRPADRHYRIGAVGAGFIMRDVQLVAYRNAGYNVAAIAARRPEQAREVAKLRGIPKVYDDWRALVADPSIEVLDVAVPPHVQSEVLLEAARYASHFRGVLAQKPFALNYREAKTTVDGCERGTEAGREPEHALRSIHPGAENLARSRRSRDPCWRRSKCERSHTGCPGRGFTTG